MFIIYQHFFCPLISFNWSKTFQNFKQKYQLLINSQLFKKGGKWWKKYITCFVFLMFILTLNFSFLMHIHNFCSWSFPYSYWALFRSMSEAVTTHWSIWGLSGDINAELFQNHVIKPSRILRLGVEQCRKYCLCFKLPVLVLRYFVMQKWKGVLSIYHRYDVADSKVFVQKNLSVFIFTLESSKLLFLVKLFKRITDRSENNTHF